MLKFGDADAPQTGLIRARHDLFRTHLSQQTPSRHPLVRLAGLLHWEVFEARFGPLYHPHVGRPGAQPRSLSSGCD